MLGEESFFQTNFGWNPERLFPRKIAEEVPQILAEKPGWLGERKRTPTINKGWSDFLLRDFSVLGKHDIQFLLSLTFIHQISNSNWSSYQASGWMNKSNIGKSRQKTPRISSHRISIHPPVHQILAPEECSQRFSRLATTSSSDALNTKAGSKEISLDRRFGGSVPEAPPIHHFDLALSVQCTW